MSELDTYSAHYEIYRVLKRYKSKVLDIMEFFNSNAFFLGERERQRMYALWNTEKLKIENLITQFGGLSNPDDINNFITSKFYLSVGDDLGMGTYKYKEYTPHSTTEKTKQFNALQPKE